MLHHINYQRWNIYNEREWRTGKFQLSVDATGSATGMADREVSAVGWCNWLSHLCRCLHVACKDVHKSGFAGSRRPKDCCQLPGSEFAADCLKNSPLACNKQDHSKTLQYCPKTNRMTFLKHTGRKRKVKPLLLVSHLWIVLSMSQYVHVVVSPRYFSPNTHHHYLRNRFDFRFHSTCL